MRNLKVYMAYNGTLYHGFQRQVNAVSVQQTVEEAIKILLKTDAAINGCSRTDSGVHAKQFCFNFLTDSRIPCDGFVKGMNTILPDDISITSCCDSDMGFNARFDCKGKQYLYRINNSGNKDVFLQGLAYHYPYHCDMDIMKEGAEHLCGKHDFAAFCRAEAKNRLKSTIRTIYSINIEKNDNYIDFYIEGDGFLYNMVRIIIGTLIYLSEGKRTLEDIDAALFTGDRERAGVTVPACGLYLNKVFY